MACRWFTECLLKLLNFVMLISGLGMIGYGIYLFVMWTQNGDSLNSSGIPIGAQAQGLITFGRPLMLAFPLSSSFLDKLPSAWFIYLFIAVGVIFLLISCSGCIAVSVKGACCMCCYIFLFVLLILIELAAAGFIFFYHNWEKVIPTDKTGAFYTIKNFLEDNIEIVRWVALGIVVLQIFAVILALFVRSYYTPPDYDSDDEILMQRPPMRQPLLNRQPTQNAGAPPPMPEQRRTDAWSTRMREKYGLNTAEFPYDPSDPNRYPPSAPPPPEEKRGCTIM